MGYERLMAWKLDFAKVPLGTYIYERATSGGGEIPLHLLGMLFFFETKNIRHKPERTRLFHSYGDTLSEHDMDFDWADETLHASYGSAGSRNYSGYVVRIPPLMKKSARTAKS